MYLRLLVLLWIFVAAAMGYDYLVMHRVIAGKSWLQEFSCKYLHYCQKLTPEPGRILSFTLGWIGFGVICLGNLYIIRKNVVALRKLGNLQHWLNWHIFFGLMGPTIIVFHCDFKVNGLVAISFWSMMISAASGVVGRYFYIQLLENKTALRQEIQVYEESFRLFVRHLGQPQAAQTMEVAMARAFYMVGGVDQNGLARLGMSGFLINAMFGELRAFFFLPAVPWRNAYPLRRMLKKWAIKRKKLLSLHIYKMLFGYWRTFHTPFAIFMYVVAIIHIVSSLIFKVN